MMLPEGYILKINCRLANESQKLAAKSERYVRFDKEYIKYRVTQLLSKITSGDKVSVLASLIAEIETLKAASPVEKIEEKNEIENEQV
ncbi:hypothetical protein [Okeania sp. SIO2B3]|uniref:hypothetical protein n=1 Tax=Okeania sp. SIO2B3 TaxID=2607784 RepID=UPI0013C1717A|nr:hypothetical protein [Okeania sp. SIO2B3]NET40606.1 hypothetical protein [Okeania sp. SIO2B3]